MKLALLFSIIFCLVLLANSSLKTCEKTPKWRLSGRTFPHSFPGHIKLVAFFRASCPFCRVQAKRLDDLRIEMQESHPGIAFLIVSSLEIKSPNESDVFRNLTSMPVLQDIAKINVWGIYNGSLDDMLIFDKCNRLVNHLSMPLSFVHTGSVKTELVKAYTQETCGKTCNSKRARGTTQHMLSSVATN